MIKSKLIQLFQTLNTQELEGFYKWLKSPLHNSDEKLIELFNYISSRRTITATTVAKKRTFKAIYPNEEYDDLKLRRLMSKGCQAIEKFVAFWMLKKDDFLQKKYWIDYLKDRQCVKLAQQQLAQQQQRLPANPLRNHSYYYQAYQLEQAHFEQAALQSRMQTTNLQTIFDHFSTAFVVENLRYACVAVSHENLYKTSYSIPLLNSILELVEQGVYDEVPTIQMYYHAYQALTQTENVQHFEQLTAGLTAYQHLLPLKESGDLYMLAINYCIKHINSSESERFMQQGFALYKQGLEAGIFIENGVLSRFTYKNVVTLGLRLGKYDWIEHCIPTYAPYLEERYRANYEHYLQSKLYFAKGDYDQAMQRLIQVEYQDLFLNLDAKTMLMKIYYETQSFDALEAFFHSFTIYLQRKSILVHHQKNYLNIIRLTKKLLEFIPYDKNYKRNLIEQIQETHPLTERQWLLQQTNKL